GFNIKDAEGNPVGEIAWSDLFNVIRDTPGVRKMGDARLDLTLNGLPADVRLNVREFPVLRTVTLVNGDTGELL
nr:t4-like baseplate wedge [Dehalococcoidia bacterium]